MKKNVFIFNDMIGYKKGTQKRKRLSEVKMGRCLANLHLLIVNLFPSSVSHGKGLSCEDFEHPIVYRTMNRGTSLFAGDMTESK